MTTYLQKLAFLAALLVCSTSFGQIVGHNEGQVLIKGRPVPFAKIRVCEEDTHCQPVKTYSDPNLKNELAQPINADARGNYSYYLSPNCVDEVFSAPQITTPIRKRICTGLVLHR